MGTLKLTCRSCSNSASTLVSISFKVASSAFWVNLELLWVYLGHSKLQVNQLESVWITSTWWEGPKSQGVSSSQIDTLQLIDTLIDTSPGAFVTDQEDPGELCQDDQERGNGVFNAPLQMKMKNSFLIDWLWVPGMWNMPWRYESASKEA